MNKQLISTAAAPKAIGPYSQGIKAAPFVFVSGQTPLNPISGKIESDKAADQTRRCLQNVSEILTELGLGMENVVKTTVFLIDMADFAAMNTVYAEFFPASPPARSTIAVAGLPLGARVEIEAIAVAD